jgi:uncharacterized membrane protein YjgN (DUF898 family)
MCAKLCFTSSSARATVYFVLFLYMFSFSSAVIRLSMHHWWDTYAKMNPEFCSSEFCISGSCSAGSLADSGQGDVFFFL